METLSYKTLEAMNYDGYLLKDAPERVLQFGEGNFLRAFVDYFMDCMNERAGFNSKVVLCQPIAQGLSELLNAQDCLYTLYLRGFENGGAVNNKRIISCVSRCINPYADYESYLKNAANPDLRYIVSNTTEAGIAYDPSCNFEDKPANSFPGKLTQLLYERFKLFGSQKGKGFIILSCELIDDNGKELKKIVKKYIEQWKLGSEFEKWIDDENIFCSTLVDRIVPGYPRAEIDKINEENGYKDNCVDTAECFGFWVIEGPDSIAEEIPFAKAKLPVLVTADHKPYKQRKVRILNGAHTSFVLGAYLAGQSIVRDCMHDEVIAKFMNDTIYDEIIPTLTLPKDDCMEFAAAVTERFKNPFIDHALLSITLNSTSKWKARVMPSFKGYVEKFGKLPKNITASLAFYIAFFAGITGSKDNYKITENGLMAMNGDREYAIKDDAPVLEFYAAHKDDDSKTLSKAVLSNESFWGEDLSAYEGLTDKVAELLDRIKAEGAYEVFKSL